jgi:uncharacterized membrane protein YfcA
MIIFLVHCLATWYMVGLIWFVQIVHYPLFAQVPPSAYPHYERQHTRRTAWVVIPPMLLEILSGIWLLFYPPEPIVPSALGWSFGLLLLVWLSTALLQVPQHESLSRQYSAFAQQVLVRTNWIRTVAWSLRGVILAAVCLQSMS